MKSGAKVQKIFGMAKDTFFTFAHARAPCHARVMRIDPFSKKEIIYKNEKST